MGRMPAGQKGLREQYWVQVEVWTQFVLLPQELLLGSGTTQQVPLSATGRKGSLPWASWSHRFYPTLHASPQLPWGVTRTPTLPPSLHSAPPHGDPVLKGRLARVCESCLRNPCLTVCAVTPTLRPLIGPLRTGDPG